MLIADARRNQPNLPQSIQNTNFTNSSQNTNFTNSSEAGLGELAGPITLSPPVVTVTQRRGVTDYRASTSKIRSFLNQYVTIGAPRRPVRWVCNFIPREFSDAVYQNAVREVLRRRLNARSWNDVQQRLNRGERIFASQTEVNQLVNEVVNYLRDQYGIRPDNNRCTNQRLLVDGRVVSQCRLTCS